MIYVASPYSSPIIGVRETRYEMVREFCDRAVSLGYVAFSPIAYCHPIAERIKCPTDANFWMSFNMSILRRADVMWALHLHGWENSQGMKIELNTCKMLNIPVVKYDHNFKLLSEEFRGMLPEQF